MDPKSESFAPETKKSWADEEEEELSKKVDNLQVPKEDDSESLHQGKVVIEQDDPNSPLYSVKTFEELQLKPEILQGVVAKGFNKPSKIQETALPILLGTPQKNLIAQAQSGTGKTATFAINMLSKCDKTVAFPQAVCTCPTRELARQIFENVKELGKFTGLDFLLVVKDEDLPKKVTSQIVVGTPGKLLDLVKKNALNLSKVKVFVLDEADQMIDQSGLGDQSIKIRKMLPRTAQLCLFSATYRAEVRQFAERMVPKPTVGISLKQEEITLDGIKMLYIDAKDEAGKFSVLSDIYGYLTVGQSIIFVHTRKTAKELAQKMTQAGHTISVIHGGEEMSSQQRDKVMDDFRDAKTKVLIATNVLARGIDVFQVTLVINYDLPYDQNNKVDPQTYVHRIGRSGRFGRRGIAISLVHDATSRRNVQWLEKFLKRPIEEFPADKIESLQEMLEDLEGDYKQEQK